MPKELENVMTNHFEKKHLIALMCIVFLTIVVWNLPTDIFHINGLTVIHQRIIAIFVFATLMWISEAIPSWATSLGIIALMCLTVSNHSLFFFKNLFYASALIFHVIKTVPIFIPRLIS